MPTLIICLFALFIMVGCSKPEEKTLEEPLYFFVWNDDTKQGQCLNKQNQMGYNPKFLGPCGDLRGLKLRRSSLDGIDLRGAIIDGVDLSGLSMNGANMKGIKARGALFIGTQLNGAKLKFGQFQGSRFDDAHLNGADFSDAELSGVKLNNAHVYGSQMIRTDLSGAALPKHLNTVKLQHAQYSFGTQLPFSSKQAHVLEMWSQKRENPSLALEEKKEKRLPASKELPPTPNDPSMN